MARVVKKYRLDPLWLHIKRHVVIYVILEFGIYIPSFLYLTVSTWHHTFAPPVLFLIILYPTLNFLTVFGIKYAIFFAENRAGEKLLREKEERELKEASAPTSGGE